RGPVRSRWERSGDGLTLQVDVPANVTAEVWIPAEATDHVTEGQRDAAIREWRDGVAIVEIGSGAWTFTARR
ncbi:MAG TPA: alpha-L-rhamnosidase C-terminal domain-containing protein, partial [Thermomicrobiales bacterium]|nr:alpha-L-rhamnosidase C-terminal domain-containing protein [Thermomicrobiales bacterium]